MSDTEKSAGAKAATPAREPGSKPVHKERSPRVITSGYRANVPFQRVSATKVRRIADNVRRKPYTEAIALLDVLPHKGARLLRKLIQSAAANALAHNKNLDEGMLYVKEYLRRPGNFFVMNSTAPIFCQPMAFSIPEAVS